MALGDMAMIFIREPPQFKRHAHMGVFFGVPLFGWFLRGTNRSHIFLGDLTHPRVLFLSGVAQKETQSNPGKRR